MKYAFLEEHRATWPIASLCRVLAHQTRGNSESGLPLHEFLRFHPLEIRNAVSKIDENRTSDDFFFVYAMGGELILSIRYALFLVCTAICLSGCGSGEARLYPVKGKVTGGTGSLKGLMIVFNPVDPKSVNSSAVLGEDGSYSLRCGDGRDGAVPGKYKVTFVLSGDAMQAAMKDMAKNPPKTGLGPGGGGAPSKMPGMNVSLPVPEEYSAASTSPKEVEVKEEGNVIDIAL